MRESPHMDFDWNHLRGFLAVARCGRLTIAAARAHTDHTTISRRITCLEHALQAKLFDRSSTGYTLTEQGRKLMPLAERMEALSLTASDLVQGSMGAIEGTVRIGAPEGFGSYFLASRLGRLGEKHPGLSIQVLASPNVYSLAKRDADIVISVTRPSEGRLVSRKLIDYDLGLYAAPAYLDSQPAINSASDLGPHRFVGYIGELLQSPELDYLQAINSAVQTHVQSSNLVAQLKATLAGAGLCVLPAFIANEEAGLLPVLAEEVRLTRSLWLIVHEDQKDLSRIKAVSRFITEEVKISADSFHEFTAHHHRQIGQSRHRRNGADLLQ